VDDDEARQPDESEIDHRDRLVRKRGAEEEQKKVELFRTYMQPAEQVARDLGAQVTSVLKSVIGPVETRVQSPCDAPAGITPTTASTSIMLEARSKSGAKARVLIVVEPVLQGPPVAEELQYKLTGSLGYEGQGTNFGGASLPLARSNLGRTIVDIEALRTEIRKAARLA
jgi:hypothetical protein